MKGLNLSGRKPPTNRTETESFGKITAYLDQLYRKYGNRSGTCFFLPSVLSLSKKLGCPAVDIHKAMQALTEKGYRFLLLDMDSPVTLWYPRQSAC